MDHTGAPRRQSLTSVADAGPLRARYGDRPLDDAACFLGEAAIEQVALHDGLDQHFARLWLDLAAGIGRRTALDTRTRHLVLVGQLAVTKSLDALDRAIRVALADGVPPREVLEVVLQCAVYGGLSVADPALEVFERVAREAGALSELRRDQLPLDGPMDARSLADERPAWHPDDAADTRLDGLVARHGWHGISTGLRLRPRHHLSTLAWLDAIDPELADLWLRVTYEGMYGRGVLDDRTRLLCMVADCVALGESLQAREHMRGAMRAGAAPREIVEVIFQSCLYFGMPRMMGELRSFVRVLAEDGRLDEIGNPPVLVG